MPGYYNKDDLKEQLDISNIYDLLSDLGGEPEYFGTDVLISQTICHNLPGDGSRKLYYYANTKLCRCYTACDSAFDIFELMIKVAKIQWDKDWELYDAMCYIAQYFGLAESQRSENQDPLELKDWAVLRRYENMAEKTVVVRPMPQLKAYNPIILTRFSYLPIASWEAEGISREVCNHALIGYYPGGEQITIPHFDINNRLVGIRGRFLAEEDAKRYGKYKPLTVNRQLYNHPLSANLYGLNKNQSNIKQSKTAIIFEGEKSVLKYSSYFGEDNNISVACCGSSLSSFQVKMLLDLGVQEIILAFDRQFQEIGDDEFKQLKKKLIAINKKYGLYLKISAIFDKEMITGYKDAPIDQGMETFKYLLKNRIIPR